MTLDPDLKEYRHPMFNREYEADMKLSRLVIVMAAFWLVAGDAAPVFSADTQLAQGKKEKGMSMGKGSEKMSKGSEEVEEIIQEKDERLKGKENALERGEGEKKGLISQMEEGTKAEKAKKAKKSK
jgi:hypothetical protein